MKKTCHALLLSGLVLLSGCGQIALTGDAANANACDTVFLVLNGSNAPCADADALQESMLHFQDGSTASIVVADGSPACVGSVRYVSQANNSQKQQQEQKRWRSELADALENVAPQQAETDLFKGLEMSSRLLRSGEAPDKTLVVYHSGYNTGTSFPFQDCQDALFDSGGYSMEELLSLTPQVSFPADTVVYWFYLGDSDGEQPAASQGQISWLRSFWSGYLLRCGVSASNLHLMDTLPTRGENPDAPPVSVIASQEPAFQLTSLSEEGVTLDTETLTFLPDSIEFRDPAAALQLLDALGRALCQTGGERFVIAGSIASVPGQTTDSARAFSLARAQTVRRELVRTFPELSDRLVCVGLGDAAHPWRSTDEAMNRAVYIVRESCEKGQVFLEIAAQQKQECEA